MSQLLSSSSSVPTTDTSSNTDATTLATTDVTEIKYNTDRSSDFMECIPLEIRLEIYSMMGRHFIYEPHGGLDYDCDHQDASNYFNEFWYGPGGYEIIKAYCLMEPQIKIAAVMNDVDALHMLLSNIKDIIPQRTDQTLLPKDEDCPYYQDFRDGDDLIKYRPAQILAMYGRLAVLKWYCNEYRIGLREDLCECAAFGGHRHIIEWMMKQDSMAGIEKSKICRQAASGGHWKLLVWLREQGCPWNAEVCSEAVQSGRFELLRNLHEHRCPWNEDTCYYAAYQGSLEMLRYAHEHGCPWNEQTCSHAAIEGHLDILRYAHEHGCPWSATTCTWAARMGHLDILRYAHEHGCPWNEQTCSHAADEGHLNILRYAHEHGCPWNAKTCSEASRMGHFDLLRYAHEHDCPWNEETFRNSRHHLEIRTYLCEHECPGSQEIESEVDGSKVLEEEHDDEGYEGWKWR